MTSALRITLPFIAIGALSACAGSGSGGQDDLDNFKIRASRALAQAERLNELSPTGAAYMPVTGSADFTGNAGIFIDPDLDIDSDDIEIIGRADLTANFNDGTVTGAVTNMKAATNITDTSADISDVRGQVNIGRNQSGIGNDAGNVNDAHNEWNADYAGTLGIQGNSYELGGSLNGIFLGNRPDPSEGQSSIKGIAGGDEAGDAYMNNGLDPILVQIEIIGEN